MSPHLHKRTMNHQQYRNTLREVSLCMLVVWFAMIRTVGWYRAAVVLVLIWCHLVVSVLPQPPEENQPEDTEDTTTITTEASEASEALTVKQEQEEDPGPLDEAHRIEQYHLRGNSWPPSFRSDATPEWKRIVTQRLEQLQAANLTSLDDLYEGYLQLLYGGTLMPNFTEYGWGLCRTCCPLDLLQDLQAAVAAVPPEARGWESASETDGPEPAWMVDRPDLAQRVLTELHPYVQAWVGGLALTPHKAYGLRLYRQQSKLWMHLDRRETHVISFILHVGSQGTNSTAAGAWPLYIEDLHGVTHAVSLHPGDVLFYESSKCWHGRPQPFDGEWYTSMFAHYYPSHVDLPTVQDAHFAVPPDWNVVGHNDNHAASLYPPLQVHGTSFVEPTCPNEWCATEAATLWNVEPDENVYRNQNPEDASALTWTDARGREHALPVASSETVTTTKPNDDEL